MNKMTVSEALMKLSCDPGQGRKDISHFMHVWGYARTIGQLEGLDEETCYILEMAAILHDIACPLCRKKYGAAIGKYQETEGMPMTREFFENSGLSGEEIERITYLVGHHHTYSNVQGADYQILLEADYITNAMESGYSAGNIQTAYETLFRTESGKALLKGIFDI